MQILNLTPHAIAVQLPDGSRQTFAPAGAPARVSSSSADAGDVAGIPLRATAWGDIVGLPAPAPGVVYVVSALVAGRALRPDVVSPDTGPSAIRADGQIVAVTGFVKWA